MTSLSGGRPTAANSAHQRSPRSHTPTAKTASDGTSHQRFESASASAVSSSATPRSARYSATTVTTRPAASSSGRAERVVAHRRRSRTWMSTPTALKPSRHVMFLPSAYVRP